MKLPNFLTFEPFRDAKRSMGIREDKLGDLTAIIVATTGLPLEKLQALSNGGLDIESLDEVKVNSDGTLSDEKQTKRVLLYIRDVSGYGFFQSDPRFHFANCQTLQEMRTNSRFGRYVIATKDDGEFTVYVGNSKTETNKRLQVCKNCLDCLKFEGYDRNWPRSKRNSAVSNFEITKFFELYPKSLHHDTPDFTEITAPRNLYHEDFTILSRQLRSERGWRCEAIACGVVLLKAEHQKYLHVHHIDGQKNRNARSNLKILCLYCHSQQYQHQHMYGSSGYNDFVKLRQQLLRT